QQARLYWPEPGSEQGVSRQTHGGTFGRCAPNCAKSRDRAHRCRAATTDDQRCAARFQRRQRGGIADCQSEGLRMDLTLIDDKGQPTAKLSASDALFGQAFNEALVHQVVTAYMANGRQGTRAQKERGEINKSKKKPWKQKGTGRARAGAAN